MVDDPATVLKMLGVEAARAAFLRECHEMYGQGGNLAERHLALIADAKTCDGALAPTTMAGRQKADSHRKAPLAIAGMQQVLDVFSEAALERGEDDLRSSASRICVGLAPLAGTNHDFDLLVELDRPPPPPPHLATPALARDHYLAAAAGGKRDASGARGFGGYAAPLFPRCHGIREEEPTDPVFHAGYCPMTPYYTPASALSATTRFDYEDPAYGPATSPAYGPTSPAYNPVTPAYVPSGPVYDPAASASPAYSPTDPAYAPLEGTYSPTFAYAPTSPAYTPYDPTSAGRPGRCHGGQYSPTDPGSVDAADPDLYDPDHPVVSSDASDIPYDPTSPTYVPAGAEADDATTAGGPCYWVDRGSPIHLNLNEMPKEDSDVEMEDPDNKMEDPPMWR
jgi:DNA-directed RNA polymerase II subunit RPB1